MIVSLRAGGQHKIHDSLGLPTAFMTIWKNMYFALHAWWVSDTKNFTVSLLKSELTPKAGAQVTAPPSEGIRNHVLSKGLWVGVVRCETAMKPRNACPRDSPGGDFFFIKDKQEILLNRILILSFHLTNGNVLVYECVIKIVLS
jgi:hypothetical protein